MKIAFLIDPINSLNPKKDSSIMLMEEALKKDHRIFFFEIKDIHIIQNKCFLNIVEILIIKNNKTWFKKVKNLNVEPSFLDIILIRKDPPFDQEYLHATQILNTFKSSNLKIYNDPLSLQFHNEKLSILNFPNLIAPTIVTKKMDIIISFAKKYKEIILKTLDGMGGSSIFKSGISDSNLKVIINTLTKNGFNYIMVQKFIPKINLGDKRIIMINGKTGSYSLARIPKKGEHLGNIAAGGSPLAKKLTKKETLITKKVSKYLIQNNIVLAGLDVIGGYLTEINITSPTCMKEIYEQSGENYAKKFIKFLENVSE